MDQLEFFHQKLRPYIKALLLHEFGLLCDTVEIDNVGSGGIVEKHFSGSGDRFQLKIIYCRKPIFWYVLMNSENLWQPPDFIMEDNFLLRTDSAFIMSKVPSLGNWCPSDVNCLLNVVLELLELYKEDQINYLKDPKLNRYLLEYETLLTLKNLPKNDMEVCVQSSGRSVIVTFLISINLDFSSLPLNMPNQKNPAVLMVEFKDNTRNVIQLIPRAELEDALGDLGELPEQPSDVALMDYVPKIRDILQSKIDKVGLGLKKRKLLYAYLINYFEPSTLNSDTVTFQKVSFLLELDGFYSVLEVCIPLNFPDQCPSLFFLTSVKSKNGLPRTEQPTDYPYSPRWSCERIAKEIFLYVRNKAVPEFRENLVR